MSLADKRAAADSNEHRAWAPDNLIPNRCSLATADPIGVRVSFDERAQCEACTNLGSRILRLDPHAESEGINRYRKI
jgi:hypothetical protein